MNDFSLAGKRAVVTGAGRGLGREIAIALADYGADVAGFSRSAPELDSLAKEIAARGRRFTSVAGDVGSRADIARLAAHTNDVLGGVDILVNNAGIAHVNRRLTFRRALGGAVHRNVAGVRVRASLRARNDRAAVRPRHQHIVDLGNHRPARSRSVCLEQRGAQCAYEESRSRMGSFGRDGQRDCTDGRTHSTRAAGVGNTRER